MRSGTTAWWASPTTPWLSAQVTSASPRREIAIETSGAAPSADRLSARRRPRLARRGARADWRVFWSAVLRATRRRPGAARGRAPFHSSVHRRRRGYGGKRSSSPLRSTAIVTFPTLAHSPRGCQLSRPSAPHYPELTAWPKRCSRPRYSRERNKPGGVSVSRRCLPTASPGAADVRGRTDDDRRRGAPPHSESGLLVLVGDPSSR
jgi:hypothetical protein